jgi:uncharacterized protein
VITWLVDTGPLVAYLDGGDREHHAVVERLDAYSGALVTTSAVITEAMHLVSAAQAGPGLLAQFVQASGLTVCDPCQAPELREAAALMEKYRSLPMDFADATLVLLSEALEVREILTLDRGGFTAFRTRDGKPFVLILDER